MQKKHHMRAVLRNHLFVTTLCESLPPYIIGSRLVASVLHNNEAEYVYLSYLLRLEGPVYSPYMHTRASCAQGRVMIPAMSKTQLDFKKLPEKQVWPEFASSLEEGEDEA
jgi:hypothetical protein